MLEYTATFTIPEWAIAYLEYGDGAGLTPDEIAQIKRFEAQLTAYGPHTWEWGNNIEFCTDNDIGGLACNCVELHLFVDVPRMASDPTRAEMIRELISVFRWRRDGRKDESWKFDIEAAIYWFSSHWHSGRGSNLYSALSTSAYRPGRLCNGPEIGSQEHEMYMRLVSIFCPGLEIGSQQHDMYIHLTETFCPKFD